MALRSGFPRRLLVGACLLGLFVLLDLALFGWLIFRSLSQREISRVLLETREEIETLAEHLAGRAQEQGQDLYLAVATERETQTYIDSVLAQRDTVRTVEIRDHEGKLVYQMQTHETLPVAEAALEIGSSEVHPQLEQRTTERESTLDVYDLTVPIGDLGQIHIGLSQEELEQRVGVLQSELVRQAAVVGAVTLGLLVGAFLLIWWLVRRGRALEEQAEEAERMAYIGTLAAGLAHEIRNPLNSLNLNMQMLEEDLPSDQSRAGASRLLGITRSEIGRLERLVSDFLAYARPRPPELAVVPAVRPLQRLSEMLEAQAREKGARLRVEDEAPACWIEIDPGQINQLLLNLAHNALHATEGLRRRPELVLRARCDGGRVALEVEDNGAGIPASELGKVFDVFFSTRKGGTGLGLPIARRIALSHGGELEVGSVVGQGTTVRIWLPRAPTPTPAAAREGGPATLVPRLGRAVTAQMDVEADSKSSSVMN